MPWKLIVYLVILGFILAFVGLNIGNTSDISFGFIVYEDVPVFIGLFAAFFMGALVSLPIAVQSASRKTKLSTEKRFNRKLEKDQKKEEKARKRGTSSATVSLEEPDSSGSTSVEPANEGSPREK